MREEGGRGHAQRCGHRSTAQGDVEPRDTGSPSELGQPRKQILLPNLQKAHGPADTMIFDLPFCKASREHVGVV